MDKRPALRPGFPRIPCKHAWSDWSGAFWVQLCDERTGRPIRMERRQRRVCRWCGDHEERRTNA